MTITCLHTSTCGVSQGSVLSPLFFIHPHHTAILISSLSLHHHLYADDKHILFCHSSAFHSIFTAFACKILYKIYPPGVGVQNESMTLPKYQLKNFQISWTCRRQTVKRSKNGFYPLNFIDWLIDWLRIGVNVEQRILISGVFQTADIDR